MVGRIYRDIAQDIKRRSADMLRRKIEALHISHGQSPMSSYVTVSIGVTYTIPNINTSSEDLFKVADKALYQAKNDKT
ncbi:diguanylate cyclase domain-containing protein [Desulfotomaculum sp. 1211_IL3151]|uniref:diguanylate cyclase domain-containing protein n=1 Tax=Desulfotomaculum sp. 1211_IL3151 TaxID=3084055 RepID=UPI002FDAA538